MSSILKGIQLNEVNPHDYDSDWDYQNAVARSGRSRFRSSDSYDAHDDENDAYEMHKRFAATRARKEAEAKAAAEKAKTGEQGVAEEQLDELSPQTLASYKKKAGADATAADKRGDYDRGNKRMSGIVKATKKEFDNDAKGVSEELDENLHKWFKEKWVRFGPDGKIRGDCARGDDSEGKPKCLPQSKAHSLGKKGRASAASRKRREDPNPERSGKAINVNTKKKTNEQELDEACWKGYHKEGNKKMFGKTYPNCVKNTNEELDIEEGRENYNGLNILLQKDDEELFVKASAGGRELGHVLFVIDNGYLMPQDLEVEERFRGQGIAQTMYDYVKSKGYKIRRSGQQTDAGAGFWDKHRPEQNVWEEHHSETCPHCGGEMVSEELMNEKKDACYYKVKSRYKVWPSAYASGALVKCRKKGASNWGNGGKSNEGVAEEGYGNDPSQRVDPRTGKKYVPPKSPLGQGVAEDQLDEKWSQKYKDSINCSNPKGFSQKAHCAGKQKNESAIMKGLKL